MTDERFAKMDVNVLIADASRSNRVMLRKWLSRLGYHCQTVETGRQTLDALREFSFDVLLLDMKFPDMEGWHVLRMIKRQPVGNRPLVVAVTACAMPGDQQRVLNWGCDAYLAKPVDLHQLTQSIEQLLVESDHRRLIA